MKKVVSYGLITGGFDPIHGGHIDYIKEAASYCDYLWVGVNTDEWLKRKKGYNFLPYEERCEIIANMKQVNGIVAFNDDDNTASNAIAEMIRVGETLDGDRFVIRFMNGGDRTRSNTPEEQQYRLSTYVEFYYGVGGTDKRNSSSDLVKNVRTEKPVVNSNVVHRNWGWYEVLEENKNKIIDSKVKVLVVNPGAALSLQYHNHRSEIWFIAEGYGKLETNGKIMDIGAGMTVEIGVQQHHRLINSTDKELVVYEIQYGTKCEEEDIVRL